MMFLSFLTVLFLLVPAWAQPRRAVRGEWGDTFDMKVIPIHAMLLPDGQVLLYGTNNNGRQGGDLYYEVWDVRTGKHTVSGNHKLLRHSTNTDVFCSTLNMDVSTGNILIMGGDDGKNYGVTDALEFNYQTHEIRKHPKGDMKYPRWYGTSINLPNGDIFVAGGRAGSKETKASPIPEVWTPSNGFRALPGARMPGIMRREGWWYPHVYVNSGGDIIAIMANGEDTDVYRVSTDGNGKATRVGRKPFMSDRLSASVMYDVDRVAMLDNDGGLWVADISNSNKPSFRKRSDVGKGRTNAAMSPLPDGRVVITGGSATTAGNGNRLGSAVKDVQIWDPLSNEVFTGPNEDIARLYHSSGLILPDGTIFSAGGGAPGPLKNLNGQVYSPNYLFNSETGAVATRPVIEEAPQTIKAGSDFMITVDSVRRLDKVTALKAGSMTHARNCDARWLDLTYNVVSRAKGEVEVSTPNRNIMVPGLWTLYTIDDNGVPAQGQLIRVRP